MTDDLLPVPPLKGPIFETGAYRVAMIIDGVVFQVMSYDADEAAKFLSNPKFVQIPKSLYVKPGDFYKDDKFISKE